MEELLDISNLLIDSTRIDFKRYLYEKIDWGERLIGIKGARGTGKTTLVFQYLKEKKLAGVQVSYFSLDELFFLSNSLLDTIKRFYQSGGKIVALDEVHKYPTWSREIKNLYDRYPDLQIVFTGSSIVDISKEEGDLSRRAVMYELHGLSYREFLKLYHNQDLPIITLDQILDPVLNIRTLLPKEFKPLRYFPDYLKTGYYPFSSTNEEMYFKKLRQLIRTIVEYDMAEIRGFDIRNGKKLLQLLYIIAQQVPFKPNISALAEKTQIHRNSMGSYMLYLAEARLIDLQYPAGISVATLQKPEKVFLNNTNYLYALSEIKPEIGTVRETFFNSIIKVDHRVNFSKTVDFLVDNQFNFEIGGKGKSTKQATANSTWIVKDDIEFPTGQSLPIWIFGLLY
ncbi:putative AAA+ superfamily ATPase [Algoriphagus sp. 4150]|uniref:ATP-binding protein n=1 Tax=Algoriphagus sp. 4150 TaxID=2817756 RepID=UPI002857794E|nr:AAA family ATPase [Algoriphagus sp. 4150]MDR7128574.1 putative AAA+ superfamily ATPase [Algoriphagus sp. 4150]